MPMKFQSATHICLINPKRVVADRPMEKSDSFFWSRRLAYRRPRPTECPVRTTGGLVEEG